MRPLKPPTFDTEFALNTIQKNADVVIYFMMNLCLSYDQYLSRKEQNADSNNYKG